MPIDLEEIPDLDELDNNELLLLMMSNLELTLSQYRKLINITENLRAFTYTSCNLTLSFAVRDRSIQEGGLFH